MCVEETHIGRGEIRHSRLVEQYLGSSEVRRN